MMTNCCCLVKLELLVPNYLTLGKFIYMGRFGCGIENNRLSSKNVVEHYFLCFLKYF